jgi:NADH:ubiquinone oxidoreductase subunit K
MGNFSTFISISLFIIGVLAFIFNGGGNLIMIVISLEMILLSVGLFLVNLSFNFDDLVGSNLTLYL